MFVAAVKPHSTPGSPVNLELKKLEAEVKRLLDHADSIGQAQAPSNTLSQNIYTAWDICNKWVVLVMRMHEKRDPVEDFLKKKGAQIWSFLKTQIKKF